MIKIDLVYEGGETEDHRINFYDVSQALVGFQRSLALTTHLILNNEVITQAPSLKGAEIFASPPEDGSWKFTAVVISSIFALGTAPKDTAIGHLIASGYDYVVSQTLGFHVDFDKSLGQQYEEVQKESGNIKILKEDRFDSVIEKCEIAIRDMHRPISHSESAGSAKLIASVGKHREELNAKFDLETYQHVSYTEMSSSVEELYGKVSSYNINTYKGRIYSEHYGRPIPFELSQEARSSRAVYLLTTSLADNAQRLASGGEIRIVAYPNYSQAGRIKSLYVTEVSEVRN